MDFTFCRFWSMCQIHHYTFNENVNFDDKALIKESFDYWYVNVFGPGLLSKR